jgi:phosphotransferase system  glucose/maltose/N-acetylglucosamine-specific IIC component
MIRRILPVVYLVIGLVVAANGGYLTALKSVGGVLSALLAILLWPLVLFGVHFAIA